MSEIAAPGNTDAGEVVKAAARIFFRELRAMEEHERFANGRILAKIEYKTRSQTPLRPGPFALAKG